MREKATLLPIPRRHCLLAHYVIGNTRQDNTRLEAVKCKKTRYTCDPSILFEPKGVMTSLRTVQEPDAALSKLSNRERTVPSLR